MSQIFKKKLLNIIFQYQIQFLGSSGYYINYTPAWTKKKYLYWHKLLGFSNGYLPKSPIYYGLQLVMQNTKANIKYNIIIVTEEIQKLYFEDLIIYFWYKQEPLSSSARTCTPKLVSDSKSSKRLILQVLFTAGSIL